MTGGVHITDDQMWSVIQEINRTLIRVEHTGEETARRLQELTVSLRDTAADHETRIRAVEKFAFENDGVKADVEATKKFAWRTSGTLGAVASAIAIGAALVGHFA